MIDHSLAMDRLEKRMKQLQVDFQRFFSGAIEMPPQDLADSIERDLRNLRNIGRLSPRENYRLGALEARFTSYSQLNQRRMRQQETDLPTRPVPRATARPAARRPASDSVVVGGDTGGRKAYARLYEQLYPDGSGAAKGVTLDRFSDYLSDHVDRVRGKTGCDQVRVRIHEEGGKRKLKVQPVESRSDNKPDA